MPASNPADFFQQKRNTAEIKAEIGTAFFRLWCELYWAEEENADANTVIFLDLNAGTGLDAAGNALLPIKILETIAESAATEKDLTKQVKTVFADGNKGALNKLKEHIEALDFYAELKHLPIILDETSHSDFLAGWPNNTVPALMLVDPFSYQWAKEMFADTVQQGNSDLLLVFDFAKLQKAGQAEQPDTALRHFWGTQWQAIPDFYRTTASLVKREKFIVDQFAQALQDKDYYPLSFKINSPNKKQTSHYIFFASRHKAAYLKMKELLQTYSDWQMDAVPLWGVNLQHEAPAIPGFFRFSHPFCMENLIEELAQKKKEYHFQSIQQVYEEHSVGKNYVLQNYLTAFTTLRDLGRINILNSANKQVKTVTSAGIIFYKLHSASIK